MTPIRLDKEEHRELERVLTICLMYIDGGRYPPPCVPDSKKFGTFEAVGIKFFAEAKSLIQRHHRSSELWKISIMTDQWTWLGSANITVNDYSGVAKEFHRHHTLEPSGLLDGEESQFMRDILMLRMNRE